MTQLTLRQRLTSFLPFKPRKGLRSPKQTKRLLRWSVESDYPLVHTLALGWVQLLLAVVVTYFIFTAPPKPDVGPALSAALKYTTSFLAFAKLLDPWSRTRKSWRVQERKAHYRMLAARKRELESELASKHSS